MNKDHTVVLGAEGVVNNSATTRGPLSTGATFAITDKAPTDKIPIVTAGYGRSESVEGEVFGLT